MTKLVAWLARKPTAVRYSRQVEMVFVRPTLSVAALPAAGSARRTPSRPALLLVVGARERAGGYVPTSPLAVWTELGGTYPHANDVPPEGHVRARPTQLE